MKQCITCMFAHHDPSIKKLGYLNDVISCNKGKDIYAESCDINVCDIYEEQFKVGDELIYTINENIKAIILSKDFDRYKLFLSLGYTKEFEEYQMDKWKKTGNNFEMIAKMFVYLNERINSKADISLKYF